MGKITKWVCARCLWKPFVRGHSFSKVAGYQRAILVKDGLFQFFTWKFSLEKFINSIYNKYINSSEKKSLACAKTK